MQRLFLLIVITLFLCANANAKPMRSPAVEAGGATEVIDVPAIDIDGTWTPREPHRLHRVPDGPDGPGKSIRKPIPTPVAAEPLVSPEEKANKELEAAARALMIKEGDPGLQSTSVILDWLIDKLKDKIPLKKLLDALEPEVVGRSEFDKAKGKAEMNAVRKKLELEEKEFSEKNKKALEDNIKKLIPEELRFQNAIRGIASLRSEDLAVVADHILRRARIDSPVPISAELQKDVDRVLERETPANACQVHSGPACVLQKVAQGASCYCPQFQANYTWTSKLGKAVRRPVGQYCRYDDTAVDLQAKLPLGTGCYIPVDVTMNPAYPRFEYIRGQVSKTKCGPEDGSFDPNCL